jgi:hypothetical protein
MNENNEQTPPVETQEVQPPTPPTPPKPPTPPTPDDAVVAVEPRPAEPALALEPEPSRRKSPLAAALLNIIPFSLGHLYVGLYGRAAMFFAAIWISGLVLEQWLMFVFFYFLAIFDAFRQAQLVNLEDEDAPQRSAVQSPLAFGVFLIVVGAVLLLNNWFDFYYIREFLRDWWPALLILAGLWFIVAAFRDRSDRKDDDDEY